MTFILFLAWGLCIALAFAGFGKLTLSVIGVRHAAAWVLAPGVGLGVVVFTGAVLNLLGLIKRPIVIADIAIGVALFLFCLAHERKNIPWLFSQLNLLRPKGLLTALALGLIALVFVARLGAYVEMNARTFNWCDDGQAYLAFPVKMLATGSFAADPFSERRIQTTLGGFTYLEAAAIAPSGDLRITNLVDGCIGLMLLFLFAIALCRRLRLSVNQSLWVLAVVVLTPAMRVNTTSVVLPAAFLLLLALIYLEPGLGDRLSWRRLLLFGLVAGTACTLKSNAIPGMGLFTIFLLALEFRRSGAARVLRAALAIAVVVLAVLLPWMIDSKAKCNTMLYPLLGHGYHVSSYVHTASVGGTPAWLLQAVPLSITFVFTAIMLFLRPDNEQASARQVTLAAVLTAAVLPMLIGFLVQEEVVRYSNSTIWAVNVLVVAFLFTRSSWPEKTASYAVLLFTCFALEFALHSYPDHLLDWLRELKVNTLDRSEKMPEDAHVAEDRAMQQAIPVGATLLVRTDESYGYDFHRNVIWIADYPGSASLPPGIPLNGDPEAVDRYLLDHSVRYVAYSYADQANFSHELCVKRTSPVQRRHSPWMAREAEAACTIQEDFFLLGKTHRHLFDDGRAYVLDLEK